MLYDNLVTIQADFFLLWACLPYPDIMVNKIICKIAQRLIIDEKKIPFVVIIVLCFY